MSDSSQPDTWPPRWELPPPLEVPPPSELPPQSDLALPTGAGGLSTWGAAGTEPTYALPPDLPAAPAPTYQPPPPAPAPARRVGPWPIVGAVVLAVTVGVAGTLAFVRPWTSTADAAGRDPASATVAPGYPAPTTSPDLRRTSVDPATALREQVAEDQSLVAAVPEGWWVPQLSSKRDGLVADGITYSAETIWADHAAVRRANPGAALLWSGDYTTFKYGDFWVTIMPAAATSTPEEANAWCVARSFDAVHCFAKRIARTTVYGQTTQNR